MELGIAARPQDERGRAVLAPGDAAAQAARIPHADAVIVDPPRRGLDRAVLDALLASPPAALVYVSCGLESFLREAARLLDSGRYSLAALDAYALFPYTPHVETLAVFSGRPAAAGVYSRD
jgi:tRNA/tmRNA/rRNA uracil-C5-methylase (TrmA/RlmC/RlmD family)